MKSRTAVALFDGPLIPLRHCRYNIHDPLSSTTCFLCPSILSLLPLPELLMHMIGELKSMKEGTATRRSPSLLNHTDLKRRHTTSLWSNEDILFTFQASHDEVIIRSNLLPFPVRRLSRTTLP